MSVIKEMQNAAVSKIFITKVFSKWTPEFCHKNRRTGKRKTILKEGFLRNWSYRF